MKVEFSLVIPSFQQARFLRATLESVLSQDYAGREVVVLDGGSTDGSVDILREMGAPGAFSWSSAPDGGQAEAINRGLLASGGQVMAYLNSDDVYYPGALRRVAEYFSAHPECQVLYGRADHLHEDGTVDRAYPTEPWDYVRLQSECFICQPATFWRREFFLRHGKFDEQLRYSLDYDYWLRAGKTEAFRYLDGPPLAGSRIHGATKTFGERIPAHMEYLRVVLRHGGNRTAVLKWLRSLAELRAAQPTPPPDRLGLALRYARELFRAAWEFRVRPGRDLFAEAKAALVARKYSHMLCR